MAQAGFGLAIAIELNWIGLDWIVKGDDMPIGSQLKVIATEGASLSVEKLVAETP